MTPALLRLRPWVAILVGAASMAASRAEAPAGRSVTTTVLPDPFPNLPPKALARHAVVEAGAAGRTPSALLGVYDVEADRLAVKGHGPAAHGRVTANTDGTFTFVAEPGFTGTDAFEFTITDAAGGESTATMHVRVVPPRSAGATVAFHGLREVVAGDAPLRHGTGAVVPRFADVDRDGRIDILVGAAGGIAWHRNTGSAQEPAFAVGMPIVAGDVPVAVGRGRIGIAWHDVDGDRLPDLLACSEHDRSIRWFRNETPEAGPPRFAVARPLAAAGGGDVVAADIRFDVGDLDGDGAADVVTGAHSGTVRVARGSRAADGSLVLGEPEPLTAGDGGQISGSYNLNVRLVDYDGDGATDLVDSYNWGTIHVRLNGSAAGPPALAAPADCTVAGEAWSAVDLHSLCDGPVVDFADIDADGTPDLVVGGERGGSVRLASGIGGAGCLAFVRDLVAAHPDDLGPWLADPARAADAARLRASVAALYDTLVHLAGPTERRRLAEAVLELVAGHPRYLGRRTLDIATDKDMPSLAGQLWLAVLAAGWHDPAVRTRLCDAAGFAGPHRALVEECGLVFIDNDRSPRGAEAIRQWLVRIPREVYPGTGITANDWLGGRKYLTRGHLKNIFSGTPERGGEFGFGGDARPLIGDRGSENQFMTVVHHEASHDLDAYVRRRPEMNRRWGRLLVAAGGPDMRADPTTGWLSMDLTRAHFREAGLWNGEAGAWDAAWKAYWDRPPGAGWREFGFMRGNIPWFYASTQESLATQGNQHWNSTEGRLQVAADRWLRGYRSDLTEVLFFIDLWSDGLDKGLFFETDDASNQVLRYVRYGRTPAGHIDRIDLGDRRYEFAVDTDGVVTDIRHLPPAPGT